MKIKCPQNHELTMYSSQPRILHFKRNGSFYRRSDRKRVQRFRCSICSKHFSVATCSKAYWQKKRHINHQVSRLLVSGVSQREGHKILKINRKTFVRKFIFMAVIAHEKLNSFNQKKALVRTLQFDDLETFEHTKCKPLSVTLAVEEKSRRILGFEVSQMPAKGHLTRIALKKYGPRKDLRPQGRQKLFDRIKNYVIKPCTVKSDENPHYLNDVKQFFPESIHKTYKGRQGSLVGQGELKKIGFDPLFDLNHTCATLRARANRLIRRTWCTTKKPERLSLHLALVALHHNLQLKS